MPHRAQARDPYESRNRLVGRGGARRAPEEILLRRVYRNVNAGCGSKSRKVLFRATRALCVAPAVAFKIVDFEQLEVKLLSATLAEFTQIVDRQSEKAANKFFFEKIIDRFD